MIPQIMSVVEESDQMHHFHLQDRKTAEKSRNLHFTRSRLMRLWWDSANIAIALHVREHKIDLIKLIIIATTIVVKYVAYANFKISINSHGNN